jgi:chromosome segregation ATPase
MRWLLVFLGAFLAAPASALSPAAQEFMAITKDLEPVQCEKRRLRRQIAMAQAERRDADARALRKKFEELDKDAKTAKLEKRLAELQPQVSRSRDPDDLTEISKQQRDAFYRCD